MHAEIRNSAHALLTNYGSRQLVLNQKLSWLLLCDAANLQTLNGASQVYPFLRESFAGATALIPNPSFGEYKAAFPDAETYVDDGQVTVAGIESAAHDSAVVVFVTPNNPTGTAIPAYAVLWKARSAYRFSVEITVYVAPGMAGRGIGSMLYSHLFAALQPLGVHAVIGGIALPNEASIALHEKFGMEKVAHFQQVGFKFNRWIDVGYWERIL